MKGWFILIILNINKYIKTTPKIYDSKVGEGIF